MARARAPGRVGREGMIDVKKSHTHPVKSQSSLDDLSRLLAPALPVLAALVAELIAKQDTAHPSHVIYAHREGSLPPGLGFPSKKYLRRHAQGMANGDPDVWCEGRSRLMTSAAWARLARDERPAPSPPASSSRPVDDDAAALESLGLARVGGGR